MADVDKHAEFHRSLDEADRALTTVESEAHDARQKAEYATNVLYNRGLD